MSEEKVVMPTSSLPNQVAEIRSQVQTLLREHALVRREQAEALRNQLAQQHSDLAAIVAEQQASIRAARAEQADKERTERLSAAQVRSKATRDQLQEYAAQRQIQAASERTKRFAAIETLQNEINTLLVEWQKSRYEKATQQREALAETTVDLQINTAANLASLNRARHEQAVKPHRFEEDHIASLYQPSAEEPNQSALSSNVGVTSPPFESEALFQRGNQAGVAAYAQLVRVTIVRELEANHGRPHAEQRHQVQAYIEGLSSNIASLLRDIDLGHEQCSPAQRGQTNNVLNNLHRNLAGLLRDLEALGGAVEDPFVDELRATVNTLVDDLDVAILSLKSQPRSNSGMLGVNDEVHDDLTQIKGIGKSIEQRLNQAGIFTFIQIALSTPDELRKVIAPARVTNLNEWISSARTLAGSR